MATVLNIRDKIRHYPRLLDVHTSKIVLKESKETGKVIARGEFGRADVPTGNNRIYPRAVLEREIEKLKKEIASRNGIVGELDHPSDGRTRLRSVSHVVKALEMDEHGVITGEAEILGTEAGKTLVEIIKSGVAVGISSRGTGSVITDENGHEVVQEDFNLITFDFVAEPASPQAFPQFFTESKISKGNPMTEERLTVETLKKDYPDLIDSIEKATRARLEKEFSKRLDAVKEEYEKRMEDQKETLRTEFLSLFNEKKEELKAKVKEELSTDPHTATAVGILDQIKRTLRPLFVEGDVKEVVKEKESEIKKMEDTLKTANSELEKLRVKIEELEKENGMLKAKLHEAITLAQELGYRYYVEKKLASHPDRAIVSELVGDLKDVKNSEELNERIEAAIERAKQLKERAGGNDASVEDKELKNKLTHMEEENTRLRDLLKENLGMAKGFAIQAYIEKRIGGHPRAPELRRVLEGMEFKTKEDVDRVLEKLLKEKKTSKEFESLRTKVAMGRTRTANEENETAEEEENQEDSNSEIESEIGASVYEIRKLAGLK